MEKIELLKGRITAKSGECDSIEDERNAIERRLKMAKRELKQLESELADAQYGIKFGDPILITEAILDEFRRRGWNNYEIGSWQGKSIAVVENVGRDGAFIVGSGTGVTSIQSELVKAARAAYLEKYA
jgi:tRNA pseudouridine-54 N-methylase